MYVNILPVSLRGPKSGESTDPDPCTEKKTKNVSRCPGKAMAKMKPISLKIYLYNLSIRSIHNQECTNALLTSLKTTISPMRYQLKPKLAIRSNRISKYQKNFQTDNLLLFQNQRDFIKIFATQISKVTFICSQKTSEEAFSEKRTVTT